MPTNSDQQKDRLKEASDEELLHFLYCSIDHQPVYEECTKEEWKAMSVWERLQGRIVPVYEEPGLLYAVNHAPIGCRFERKAGEKIVCLIGADVFDEIKRRGWVTEDNCIRNDVFTNKTNDNNVK